MKYLLDTHIILWALVGDDRLSKNVKQILEDSKNEIYYSTVSVWEVELKHMSKEKFKLSADKFTFLCDQNGLSNIQIENKDILNLEKIAKVKDTKHNNPFDRMLLAQAISENMILITHDKKFSAYANTNIMMV